MLAITFTVFCFLLLVDLARKFSQPVRLIFNKFCGSIVREHEALGYMYGSTYFMMGTFISIFFFEKEIVCASLFVLIISDTAASVFGKAFGKKKICGEKTFVGFLAFLISASLISLFFSVKLVFAAALTSVVELYAKKMRIDDNLLIPISYCIFGSIF